MGVGSMGVGGMGVGGVCMHKHSRGRGRMHVWVRWGGREMLGMPG